MIEQAHKDSFFYIVTFSMFSDVKGPVPIYCYPDSVNIDTQVEIAMKSVSLLMGEAVYQAGLSDDLKYFGILPFPELNYIGLTYFFLIPDELARGKSKAATATLVLKETDDHFLYNNIHILRILFDNARLTLRKNHELSTIKETIEDLRQNILKIWDYNQKNSNSNQLKIVCTGLDNAGKTSYIEIINSEFSELLNVAPNEQNSKHTVSLIKWDYKPKEKYHKSYFENANLYLYNVDVLMYLIDAQNPDRFEESMDLLSRIFHTLDKLKVHPEIQIILHKFDPNINSSISSKINQFKRTISQIHSNWSLQFFYTSKYDSNSIKKSFIHAISIFTSEKEPFSSLIQRFVRKVDGHSGTFLTQYGLVLGKYSKTSEWEHLTWNLKDDLFNMFQHSEDLQIPYLKIQFNGITLYYYKIQINSHEFHLVFDSPKDRKKIRKNIDLFITQTTPLVQDNLD
ncbi:MAG: hypothetical protein JW776_16095 [Candidatus Lokiarchaeota archaeon]|nr:hypothetical protein [Candidatus Lokiarchaeota archaeon]